jgi:hypothetical protein
MPEQNLEEAIRGEVEKCNDGSRPAAADDGGPTAVQY